MDKRKPKDEEEKRRRKWPYIMLLILLLLLFLLLTHSCGQHYPGPGPSPSPSSSESSNTSPSSSLDDSGSALPGSSSSPSRQEILSQLQKQQVTVTDKVSSQISFPGGSTGSAGICEVENQPSNSVIMQCEIVLNGKTVAKSVPIYPGQHIDSITLSQPVTPGNYNVTATIKYYNKTTKEYLGMTDYGIHMSVS